MSAAEWRDGIPAWEADLLMSGLVAELGLPATVGGARPDPPLPVDQPLGEVDPDPFARAPDFALKG